MELHDVKNKIAEKYECLGWDMLMLNLTLSSDFRRDYKITETMVWNELAETYASLQCAEMKKRIEELEAVLRKVNTAIQHSNMKGTILHSEIKQALNHDTINKP